MLPLIGGIPEAQVDRVEVIIVNDCLEDTVLHEHAENPISGADRDNVIILEIVRVRGERIHVEGELKKVSVELGAHVFEQVVFAVGAV